MESFDRDLLIILHDVARTLRTRFDQKARATHAMTRAQWIILSRLDRQPGMSQNEMAAICEVEPITVARLVDRLEARGLVERRADPTDRRIKRLHLLPAAKPILETINARARTDERTHHRGPRRQDARHADRCAAWCIKENLANEALTGGKLAAVGE